MHSRKYFLQGWRGGQPNKLSTYLIKEIEFTTGLEHNLCFRGVKHDGSAGPKVIIKGKLVTLAIFRCQFTFVVKFFWVHYLSRWRGHLTQKIGPLFSYCDEYGTYGWFSHFHRWFSVWTSRSWQKWSAHGDWMWRWVTWTIMRVSESTHVTSFAYLMIQARYFRSSKKTMVPDLWWDHSYWDECAIFFQVTDLGGGASQRTE